MFLFGFADAGIVSCRSAAGAGWIRGTRFRLGACAMRLCREERGIVFVTAEALLQKAADTAEGFGKRRWRRNIGAAA